MKNIMWIFSFSFIFIFTSCDPVDVLNDPKDTDTLDYVWDASKVVKINFQGSKIDVDSKNVEVNGSKITIVSSGTYELSGTLTEGQIIVNSSGIVRLLMNNVHISNSTTAPIYIYDAKRAIIILPEGTNSTVSDGVDYIITADSLNSAIYSTDYLAIYGEGALTVNGNYNSAISSRDELIIESGTLNVSSVGPAIKGKDMLIINGGDFTINSSGDALKSDKEFVANEGFIEINGGKFNIVSLRDAITAVTDIRIKGGDFNITTGGGSEIERDTTISTKGIKCGNRIAISAGTFKVNSSDNAIDASNHLLISGGQFELSSSNKPLDSDSTLTFTAGKIDILKAVKGISSHKIYLLGGEVSVNSRNDCLKATLGQDLTTNDGSLIIIDGTNLYLDTEKGDALDSNGSIVINSGVVVVQGSSSLSDDAIKYRAGFNVVGGVVVASGGASYMPDNTSTLNSVGIKFNSLIVPGMYVNIQDELGKSILTYRLDKLAYYMVITHQDLKINSTYSVYTGGSAVGNEMNGFYPDAVYTPGVKKGSFTITQKTTRVTY
jgi:hypothetical protein